MSGAPLVDARTAATLREELLQKLRDNVPGMVGRRSAHRSAGSGGAALIGIFARFGEIVIQRLNQVPDKNFLAFLDLLGVRAIRRNPRACRSPSRWHRAASSDAVVPAGTQVAAPPAEGETEPVLFETERELPVVAATLAIADHGGRRARPGGRSQRACWPRPTRRARRSSPAIAATSTCCTSATALI